MLTSLTVCDLALIRRLDADFKQGFTVLTGETGAGKSLILDSFQLFLNRGTKKDLVRRGAPKTSVSMFFDELSSVAKTRLADDLSPEELEEGIGLYAEVSANGKSQYKLNGRTVPFSVMERIARALFAVNAQHDAGGLLDEKTHRDYLDDALDDVGKEALAEYRAAFAELSRLEKEWNATLSPEDEKEKLEWYDFQMARIARVKPRPGEEEALEERLRIIQANTQKRGALELALRALTGGEKGKGAVYLLEAAAQKLEKTDGADNADLSGDLYELARKAREVAEETAERLDAVRDESEGGEEAIRQRIDELYRLKERYGKSVDEIILLYEKLRREKDELLNRAQQQKVLAPRLESARKRVALCGERLTEARRRASLRLEENVHRTLKFLDMKKMRFSVEFTPRETPGEGGAEDLRFVIAANTGEGAKALAKVASGGELSRILLALQCHLGTARDADTIIFDEIDTGISGATAQRVGVCLKTLSMQKQILCVTHSAQVATLGDSHYLVQKHEEDGRTETKLFLLSSEESDRETARLLGGKAVGAEALASARHLREEGQREWLEHKDEF